MLCDDGRESTRLRYRNIGIAWRVVSASSRRRVDDDQDDDRRLLCRLIELFIGQINFHFIMPGPGWPPSPTRDDHEKEIVIECIYIVLYMA